MSPFFSSNRHIPFLISVNQKLFHFYPPRALFSPSSPRCWKVVATQGRFR
ncbi:hypothetical protein HanXRQr2_Chr09g0390261 [Helianthus annuus]|uniref:Uncharacterized protein n=1 Tax=Helianthus annuus TaxID=4232 RepID=A0A9K3I5V6_HELAN|nr:hypothetical protein HanXRQr2_Chr09g0390261 [Helianthus annuus]KAJ0893307.1 hypothetical protein HanPSC8_Chr09g0376151 [Helianthus annuus]